MTTSTTAVEGVEVGADPRPDVLTPEALAWLAELQRTFGPERTSLLARRRRDRRAEIAGGATLDFLADTQKIRDGDWAVAPPPPALRNRRVEITGPTEPRC